MKNDLLTVYSPEGCVKCTATLRDVGIDFEVVGLAENHDALLKLKAAEFLQAPVVETPHQSWLGFRPDRIDDLANKRAARRGREQSSTRGHY